MTTVDLEPARAAAQNLEDYNALRIALRKVLPAEMFAPEPARGVMALAVQAFNVGIASLVVADKLPWYGDLAVALVLSQLWVTAGFVAHEALHRSVFKSRFWEDVMGWVGFSPWLLTPGLWRAWHVQAHHGGTNIRGHDPDMMVTPELLKTSQLARWVHTVTPGSGSWISYISPTFLFTMQGQLFLWHYSALPEFEKIRWNRRREQVLVVLLTLAWIGLGVWMGPWAALCTIILPMMISNVTLMSYIATNHWLRPIDADHNNPFLNTTSVVTHPLLDVLHVEFSYHQEHHIFPQMNPKHAPKLREALRELNPKAVCAWPHWQVIKALYATPSIYEADGVLVSEDGATHVDLRDVEVAFHEEKPVVGLRVAS